MLQKYLNHWFVATFGPALLGLGAGALCVQIFGEYGWMLFLGMPVVVSFLAGFAWSYKRKTRFWGTYGIAVLSNFAVGAGILAFALDGLVCLAMAVPLMLGMALLGAPLGAMLGESLKSTRGPGTTIPLLLCLLFPFLAGFEHATAPEAPVRMVQTSVEISAPIHTVWDEVVAFSDITEPPRGIFRLGIAYPIRARIDGQGVGAVRYCEFSTGEFVEPITVWDEPHALKFDVAASPPPMHEVSIYPHLHPRHFEGHLSSKRGQFILTERGGKTYLEGTTWYTHSLGPQAYWGPISDVIIHHIHRRVLNHIKADAEAQ